MNFKKIVSVALPTVLVLVVYKFYPSLNILTGYAAKSYCSCYFLAQETDEQIKTEDLNFSPVNYAQLSVNEQEKSVSASLLGFIATKTAYYREGLGCTLLHTGEKESFVPTSYEKPVFTGFDAKASWPIGDHPLDTVLPNVDYKSLQQVVANAFDEGDLWQKKTRAVVVIKDGQLIAEQYGKGISKQTPLIGWSMTKSITSALVGILVRQGKFTVDSPVPVKAWEADDRKQITWRNLLHMNSGLKWTEDYSKESDVTNMLYRENDMYTFSVSAPLAHEPGKTFYYSSGTTNILSGLVKNQFQDVNQYLDFIYKELFIPLNMRSITVEPDVVGNVVGSSYSFATARDWAKFGMLYLNHGNWYGNQILDSNWVSFSQEDAVGSEQTYSAQFWTNHAGTTLPHCPKDVYFADGFKGQRIFIVPSKNAVVVRLGLSDAQDFNHDKFLSDVLNTFK